jgi:hypothetical protein
LFEALGLVPPAYRYAPRPLLSPAERSFFGVLERALPSGSRVFVKVGLADLFQVTESGKRYRQAFNRISQKHVDFVVCHADDCAVRFCIELDDRSHQSARAVRSDRFKDQLFADAGIRLVRIKARRGYAVEELRRELSLTPPPLPASALG